MLEEGEITAGDPVERLQAPAESPGVLELFQLHYDADPPEEALQRLLRAPIPVRARDDLERRLRRDGVRRVKPGGGRRARQPSRL